MNDLVCANCGKRLEGRFLQTPAIEHNGKNYCEKCINNLLKEEEEQSRQEAIKLSTTDTLQGYKIVKYIDVSYEEVVILEGKKLIEPIIGVDNQPNKNEIHKYGEILLKQKLRQSAVAYGGNAIIGIQFFARWTNEKEFCLMLPSLILSAHGTVVSVEPI